MPCLSSQCSFVLYFLMFSCRQKVTVFIGSQTLIITNLFKSCLQVRYLGLSLNGTGQGVLNCTLQHPTRWGNVYAKWAQKKWIPFCIFIWLLHHKKNVTQDQFLSKCTNSVHYTQVKEPSLFYCLSITGERIHELILFSRVLKLWEMLTALFRIWTLFYCSRASDKFLTAIKLSFSIIKLRLWLVSTTFSLKFYLIFLMWKQGFYIL